MPQTLADAAATGVPSGAYAFVDGSFNENNGLYGYGGFLDVHGRRYPIIGSGNDPELSAMRNVAGEIEVLWQRCQKPKNWAFVN